ncbi:copper chaperone PCu(A)C [Yoonia sp. F2084L]|uniref:copper chaperone PCu(A)C n=1 Tax=Yoonia sp. F2084L TaxID=2926419 RepID=UPI001FF49CB3|nr:copper chaperone PCu(A)C [Yoonia sp. F2084L]MCK0094601.1 copper chaperone PCu(A)C [Yoonia sp. F2084L]
MKRISLAVLAFLTLSATTAVAESVITITDAKAFETAPSAMAGGGFMQITNTGTTDDRLVGVEADFPRVEIHTTEFTDGVAKMMHIDGIDVPAGETVVLEPGALHVMFMGLQGDPLEEGETVPATLIFEQAGEVEVLFNVVKRDMAAHSN